MTQWFAEKVLRLPELASTNGVAVDALMVYVHWLMFALFIGWLIYFVYVLRRFRQSRNPKADYVGGKNHASNYLELTVAAIEAVLLMVIALFLAAASRMLVRNTAERFAIKQSEVATTLETP